MELIGGGDKWPIEKYLLTLRKANAVFLPILPEVPSIPLKSFKSCERCHSWRSLYILTIYG